MMTRQFVGSSGKWSDRVVCVVSMQPAKWGKQHEQQVQRITTFRLEQSCREVNNMIPPGSCKSLPPNDEMTFSLFHFSSEFSKKRACKENQCHLWRFIQLSYILRVLDLKKFETFCSPLQYRSALFVSFVNGYERIVNGL